MKINRTKYGVGMTTLIEVFKSRASLAEAQVSLTTAQNDYATALGKLYQAVGRDISYREERGREIGGGRVSQ